VGDGIQLTLGGENATTMEFGSLTLDGNNTKISRGSELKKLSVKDVIVQGFNDDGELDLSPVDSMSTLTLQDNRGLHGINISSEAVMWENFSLSVGSSPKLLLLSEYRDAENKKDRFWYWPKGNINSIEIYGTPLGNGFL
jgi:hypothetical protein